MGETLYRNLKEHSAHAHLHFDIPDAIYAVVIIIHSSALPFILLAFNIYITKMTTNLVYLSYYATYMAYMHGIRTPKKEYLSYQIVLQ